MQTLPTNEQVQNALKLLIETSRIRTGLKARRARNELARANGNEPSPGPGAGVKRWARYLKRVPPVITDPIPHYSFARGPR